MSSVVRRVDAVAEVGTVVDRHHESSVVPAALERPYPRARHARLDAILRSPSPVLFPHDSPLPDPFDGLLVADPHALERIHACLGCPLTADGEVVGALTADALDPEAFDGLDGRLLATLGALAGEPGVQVVPEAGFEPARPGGRGILSPLRLPFRHSGAGREV